MASIITLDSIRSEIEKEYGPVQIPLGEDGTITLLNPTRMERAQRKELSEVVKAVQKETEYELDENGQPKLDQAGEKIEKEDTREEEAVLVEMRDKYAAILHAASDKDSHGLIDKLVAVLVREDGTPDILALGILVKQYFAKVKLGEA